MSTRCACSHLETRHSARTHRCLDCVGCNAFTPRVAYPPVAA